MIAEQRYDLVGIAGAGVARVGDLRFIGELTDPDGAVLFRQPVLHGHRGD